jgi:predicted ester cyclase
VEVRCTDELKVRTMTEWRETIQQMMATVSPEIQQVALGVGSVFSTLDEEAARRYIHPDFIDHEASEGVGGGPAGYLATARYMNSAFSGASWTPLQIFASGDRYAMVITFSGVHTGEFMGIPPTGMKVEVRHLHFFRVQDGQAIEHWGARDELTLLRQIGVFTPEYVTPADSGAALA